MAAKLRIGDGPHVPTCSSWLGLNDAGKILVCKHSLSSYTLKPISPPDEMLCGKVGGHHLGHTIVEVNIVVENSFVDPSDTDAVSPFDVTQR